MDREIVDRLLYVGWTLQRLTYLFIFQLRQWLQSGASGCEKRFCKICPESSPCLLGEHGSCSAAQQPVELSENILLQNLFHAPDCRYTWSCMLVVTNLTSKQRTGVFTQSVSKLDRLGSGNLCVCFSHLQQAELLWDCQNKRLWQTEWKTLYEVNSPWNINKKGTSLEPAADVNVG